MKTLEDNSVDSIVSDPPYGISFMAKKWDYDVPSVEVWKEAMRVLKHGGHALIACGTRTQHRMVCNIEDAGFEIRDVVSWIYGQGFPKSLNVSKAIDKTTGVEIEYKPTEDTDCFNISEKWDGWGTALKPSVEFFTLCRKPLSEKTVAANVLKWGTGGINIDGCRVGTEKIKINGGGVFPEGGGCTWTEVNQERTGRFPANLIHDGSQEVLDLFPVTGDKSPSRFFYCAKASKKDRDEGLDGFEEKTHGKTGAQKRITVGGSKDVELPKKNNHPTVKPTALMSYLCRLITPPNGVVLDPYMGSGSTGKAAVREGFSFIGCELDPDYYEIAKERINHESTT